MCGQPQVIVALGLKNVPAEAPTVRSVASNYPLLVKDPSISYIIYLFLPTIFNLLWEVVLVNVIPYQKLSRAEFMKTQGLSHSAQVQTK